MYVFLSLSAPLVGVVMPRYIGPFVQGVKTGKPVLNIAVSIVVIALVIGAMTFGLDKMDAYFIPKLQGFIRRELILSVINQYSENYHDPEVGKLLTQISSLPSIVREMFKNIRTILLPISLTLFVAMIYFTSINKWLGLIAATGYGMMFVITVYFGKDSFQKAIFLAEAREQFYEEITDMFSNMLTIFASNAEDFEIKRFDEIQSKFNVYLRNVMTSSNTFGYVYAIVYGIVFAFMAIVIFGLYKKKQLSESQIVSAFMVLLFVTKSLGGVTQHLRDFIYNFGALTRTNMAIQDIQKGGVLTQKVSGEIIIKDLVVQRDDFKLNIPILNIKSLDHIVITGQIGSGKSILIKTLMKLTKYTGLVSYGPHDLKDLNGVSIRKQIGFIPQQPRMFNRSIADNIIYGTKKTRIDLQKLFDDMKKIGFTALKSDDIDRFAGKNGDNISGGQRQMVSLMRLILTDDPIIILDEPTAALDKNTGEQVRMLIKALIKGKTAIIVSHDSLLIDDIKKGSQGYQKDMKEITV
jgi:ABC-type multidrug transport system fused ATPase/permease subunit